MTPPIELPTAMRHQARGLYCLEAAAELLIAQSSLGRSDFIDHFVTLDRGLFDDRLMATVDWAAAITALEQRMLRALLTEFIRGRGPPEPGLGHLHSAR